jgi:hypothetical protein
MRGRFDASSRFCLIDQHRVDQPFVLFQIAADRQDVAIGPGDMSLKAQKSCALL